MLIVKNNALAGIWISDQGSSANISYGHFENNSVGYFAAVKSHSIINKSYFISNNKRGNIEKFDHGTGLYMNDHGTRVKITNSFFKGNSARGIFNGSDDGLSMPAKLASQMIIKNSIFENNRNGVFTDVGDITISKSSFLNNDEYGLMLGEHKDYWQNSGKAARVTARLLDFKYNKFGDILIFGEFASKLVIDKSDFDFDKIYKNRASEMVIDGHLQRKIPERNYTFENP